MVEAEHVRVVRYPAKASSPPSPESSTLTCWRANWRRNRGHGRRLADRFLHVPDIGGKEIPEILRSDAEVVMLGAKSPGDQARKRPLVHTWPPSNPTVKVLTFFSVP